MQAVVLIIHLVICIALICLVLLQRSEGGALGIGGGSGSLMSGRGAADTLAKMTQFAGGFFLVTSLFLTWLSGATHQNTSRSIFDMLPHQQSAPLHPAAPTPPPAQTPAPTTPDPTQSSAPQSAPANELASVMPGPSSASAATLPVAPPPTQATTHAAPVVSTRPANLTANAGATNHPASATIAGPLPSAPAPAAHPPAAVTTTVRTQSTQTASSAVAHTQPASAPATAPATTSTQAPVRTARAPQTTTATTAPLIIPGLGPGDAESSQTGSGFEAARRSHAAGPDQ